MGVFYPGQHADLEIVLSAVRVCGSRLKSQFRIGRVKCVGPIGCVRELRFLRHTVSFCVSI